MKSSFLKQAILLTSTTLLISSVLIKIQAQDDGIHARKSARASLTHLKKVMDQYQTRFGVYEDVSSPGNHFHCYTKIPDSAAPVDMNGSFVVASTTVHNTGATVIKCEFRKSTYPFAGFYLQNGILPKGAQAPLPNFGTVPNAGINLTGATHLTFWAKGDKGGERIEFFMGGVGRNAVSGIPEQPYPDSSSRWPVLGTIFTLTTSWQQFTINLTGRNLSYVLGGFAWVADLFNNPNGAVFYLDDIQYSLNDSLQNVRLKQPRFLRSFTTLPLQPNPNDGKKADDLDLLFRNGGFSYDNALTILALLADPTAENLQYAKLLGDAFVYAGKHDRYFDDGRIRDAYSAGDISLPPGWTPNDRIGTVPLPGYYNQDSGKFVEVETNNMSTGNNAWTMVALLALYKKIPDPAYLAAALKIGQFIEICRNNTGRYQGYQGGFEDIEKPNPKRREWASTEHNLDIFVAFTLMHQITGAQQWLNGAQHAKAFVELMWDPQKKCYYTGTINPDSINTKRGQLPLDPQSWSTIASPCSGLVFQQPISCAEDNLQNFHDNFKGFDFNDDKDGVWFEGTAQMGVAYAFANLPAKAFDMRVQLRKAQNTSPYGDSAGIAAACHDSVTSGFDDFNLYRRLHIAATSWNVFAQLQFNPYFQTIPCRMAAVPTQAGLSIYPNPTRRNTSIVYSIPEDAQVTIRIFNAIGQEVTTLINGFRARGNYIVDWNGLDFKSNPVSSGLYLVNMVVDSEKITAKILLLR